MKAKPAMTPKVNVEAHEDALDEQQSATRALLEYVYWSLSMTGDLNCEAARRAIEALNRAAAHEREVVNCLSRRTTGEK